MAAAGVPEDEPGRLRALRETGLLNTPPEPIFDDLVEIARAACDVPVALVSLVDDERQWFKARVGLEITETTREVAICAHALLEPDRVLAVPDVHADPRFKDNPLVHGDPPIAAYFGQPIRRADGQPLGTLCVIDNRPRPLTDEQLLVLARLSQRIEAEIERRVALERRRSTARCLARFVAHEAEGARGEVARLRRLLDGSEPASDRLARDAIEPVVLEALEQRLETALDATLIGLGGPDPRIETVDLGGLLADVCARLGGQAEAKQVQLVSDVGDGSAVTFPSDAQRLRKILLCLVEGALERTEEGWVTVRAERRADQVCFSIEDTAADLPRPTRERLRRLLSEAPPHERARDFALYLSARSVEALGGSLQLEVNEGEGVALRFALPLRRDGEAA
ncbi:MAG: GAF domain-containing sensor histidine kinase [Planctomycetota bacterium]